MTSASRFVLGISAFYHDSAACLLRDGEIVAAASEERFSRKKGDDSFPARAVEWCLRDSGIGVGELEAVAFYDKPLLKFERILETYLAIAPRGFRSFLKAGPLWLKEKLHTDRNIRESLGGYEGAIFYAEHHESHAASAFLPSPFEEAAILTVDGVGEWATASIAHGVDSDFEILKELHWPDSLGLLYSAFTYYLGFRVNSGEYKVMGLAPYGEPRYVDSILERLVDLRDDGSFTLDQRHFDYLGGLTMTSAAFHELFGGPPRAPESEIERRHMDLARSVQVVCEEIMLRMARTAHSMTGSKRLCLAGGVALNCVANGRILREGPFEEIWIQPAAGDAGGALGCAMLAWTRQFGGRRVVRRGRDAMKGARLGPAYGDDEIEAFLRSEGATFDRLDDPALLDRVASLLADGNVVGWFDGRMEFGPRALGGRSILGDPRDPRMQSQLNLKIKFRESFRPFAPSVLAAHAGEYFDLQVESPYMLLTAAVRDSHRVQTRRDSGVGSGFERLREVRSHIPAVTHVDWSARVQTVDAERSPRFHALIRAFERITGCSMLVNTSFNVRGEPIVCSPADAYRCFMRTEMDALVLGSFLLTRSSKSVARESDSWKLQYQLD
jgi:carbamoyltransferase